MVQLIPKPTDWEMMSTTLVHFDSIILTESIIFFLTYIDEALAANLGFSLINNKQQKNATLYKQANTKFRLGI